jgi:hypothetical protein
MSWDILTEFTTKKGTDLVICNLSDNVPELGVNQYLQCPYCSTPDKTPGYSDKRRRKLYTDGYIGYCYRCHRTFLNPSVKDSEVVKLPEFNVYTKVTNFDVTKLGDSEFDNFNSLSDIGLSYLQHRNPIFSKEFCTLMNIRSINNGVVIPFYLDNSLVYYVIRFIKASHSDRYWMPPTKNKPLFIPRLVNKNKFIIVEGVFDAFACLLLYPEHTPCAVLGSKISLKQVNYLSERYNPDDIIVYLDDTEKSINTLNFIKCNWKGIYNINVVSSNGTDPEEYLKSILNG